MIGLIIFTATVIIVLIVLTIKTTKKIIRERGIK